jgi:hypothetical protein
VTDVRLPILDVCAQLAEHGDLTGLDGKKVTWAFRAVRADLRSRNEFRYPWPGQWATAPGPIHKHDDPCPSAPGDGLCIAKTFHGAAQGGIPFSTMLIVGYARRDVLAEDDHKVRVRKMYVADVVEIATLLQYADLRSADLQSADLRSANLRSADLRSADLRSANLRFATYSQLTLWPVGTDPVALGAVML